MATYDNTYSRVVAWLKIILPLLALAILSTLFLVARKIDPAQNIPYADVDIEELTREQRVGRPTYTGVTKGGAAMTLSAARAKPDLADPNRVTGDRVTAGIDLPDGGRLDVVADAAVIDSAARTAALRGGVRVTSSLGYALTTEELQLDLDTSHVTSTTGIRVTSPMGTLTAGAFEMTGDGGDARPYRLLFTDKVKLVYEPGE